MAAEVISTPLNPLEREETDNDASIQRRLKQLLLAQGLKHCQVSVGLTQRARKHSVSNAVLGKLAEAVTKAVREHGSEARLRIPLASRELAESVRDVLVLCYEWIPGVEIDTLDGQWLPSDGRWIDEAVQHKLKKYGGPERVRNVMLVIAAAAIVDDEQIAAFQAAHSKQSLPFSEIWIVAYHRVACLKDRAVGCPCGKWRIPS